VRVANRSGIAICAEARLEFGGRQTKPVSAVGGKADMQLTSHNPME